MSPHVFTIGHSNHASERFLDLLDQTAVDVLVDVRSQPISRYSPHFNQDLLRQAVLERGRKYLFLGRELGGRPEGAQFYDLEGYVRYDRVAESPAFKEGIGRLLNGISRFRVALMCSEEDPTGCHRRLLVSRVLMGQGVDVSHVRGEGHIQTEAELRALERQPTQGVLFAAPPEEREWKSLRSVLRNTARENSSASSARRESAA